MSECDVTRISGADLDTPNRIEDRAPEDLAFVPISKAQATELIVANHYLHRSCDIRWAWGVAVNGKMLGVLTVGRLSSPTATRGVIGETEGASRNPFSRSMDVYELNRLWLSDSLPVFEVQGVHRKTGKPIVHKHGVESKFIGSCLRQLKKEYPNIILVAFAEVRRARRSSISGGFIRRPTGFTPGCRCPSRTALESIGTCGSPTPEMSNCSRGNGRENHTQKKRRNRLPRIEFQLIPSPIWYGI